MFANGYIEHWYTGELVTYADFFDGFITATELVDIVHKENTLWYQIAKEHGLLEAFKNHESNNSDYVIDFTKAMLPCAADYYREALAIHTASTDKSQINESLIDNYLFTKDIPDPDLMIRTSGEYRISNFLLWQLAYAEFYFPGILFPDFTEADFDDAILAYNKRDRRFGNAK